MFFLILLTLIIVGGIVAAVVAFSNSGAGRARKENKTLRAELADANERVSIAQTALIQIASGDPTPVFRASDALGSITTSYTKGISK